MRKPIVIIKKGKKKIRDIEWGGFYAQDLLEALRATRQQKSYISLEAVATLMRAVFDRDEIIALINELTKKDD